jgi:hypothetical protein
MDMEFVGKPANINRFLNFSSYGSAKQNSICWAVDIQCEGRQRSDIRILGVINDLRAHHFRPAERKTVTSFKSITKLYRCLLITQCISRLP